MGLVHIQPSRPMQNGLLRLQVYQQPFRGYPEGDYSRYPSAMPSRRGIAGLAKPKRRSAPYPFIVEALAPLEPEVRPMFSGFAVYVGEKIMLMLRESQKQPEDNGVWLVFSEAANLADPGIRQDFPSLRLIKLLGGKIGHWRLIPADSPNFESEALHACELLLKHDMRFGRIPQSRQAPRARAAGINHDPRPSIKFQSQQPVAHTRGSTLR